MGAWFKILIPVLVLLLALACGGGSRGSGASIADRTTFPTPTPGPTPVKEEVVQRFMEEWTQTDLKTALPEDIEGLFTDIKHPKTDEPVDKAALAQAAEAALPGEATVKVSRVIEIAVSKTTQMRRYGADAEYKLPLELNGSSYILAFTYQVIVDQAVEKAVLSSGSIELTEAP
jgi:hypothetical protein